MNTVSRLGRCISHVEGIHVFANQDRVITKGQASMNVVILMHMPIEITILILLVS